eukprot:NODE_5363_length_1024_cov_45.256382_g4794_i0.p1 GENE.NODE_5363_length_1024_cov_45.256382_g4794_i0~~NODE_5363_length_1024_cov_45.256382_g4794_i0.p1  ORF type:complete len:252 (+),score=32.67 NODE_5363_length_1024_cov_45.256382_g4794_i0:62-817(+)
MSVTLEINQYPNENEIEDEADCVCDNNHVTYQAMRYGSYGSIVSIANSMSHQHDAIEYERAPPWKNAVMRMPALIVTFCIELIPCFVVSKGADELSEAGLISEALVHKMTGFINIVAALSGNVGLQCSTVVVRAISHRIITRQNWMPAYRKEVLSAICLAISFGILTGLFALAYSQSFRLSICITLAQFIAMIIAGISGTLGPIIFKIFLKRDPGLWAGPMETAIQDIAGSMCLFYLSYVMLKWVLPMHWS